MHISALHLTHFRNYEQQELSLDPRLNLFWGPNGQGKTNLLEALFYLTIGKSYRKSPDADLVLFGKDFFRLEGFFQTRFHDKVHVEIAYAAKQGKFVKVNGLKLEKISELMQTLAAVELSPEDISLTKGSPSNRRHFIDITLSQTNTGYLHALQEYRHVLGQRNELLRQRPTADTLEIWDAQLLDWGCKIWQIRLLFIAKLRELVNKLYHTLSQDVTPLALDYRPLQLETGADLATIHERFQQALQRNLKRETQFQMTLTGPHRDDVGLRFGQLDLRRFGSQGQHRLVSTALRLSQALYLQAENEDCPLILFDDVFAELDERHKSLLEEMMGQFDQVFVATPREHDLDRTRRRARIFHVNQGRATA